jgi:hypothetical protein
MKTTRSIVIFMLGMIVCQMEMWKDAWELLGDCVPMQGKFMEEKAANGGGAWKCLG